MVHTISQYFRKEGKSKQFSIEQTRLSISSFYIKGLSKKVQRPSKTGKAPAHTIPLGHRGYSHNPIDSDETIMY